MSGKPFVLHTSPLDSQGCPTDPTSPIPPPWDAPPSGIGRGQSAPAPRPSDGIDRVSEIGQMLAKYSRNPELRPYEEVFRSEPNEGWYDASRDPDHPTQFELGTIRPSGGNSLIIMDYSVLPYGFSNNTSLDYAALEDDQISSSFGYSFEINGQSPGLLRYRLDPVRSTLREEAVRFSQKKQTFDNITEDDFVRSQSTEYASAAGYGTGLHPQTSERFGGRIIPWGEFLHDDQILTVAGVVFRPIEIPLAFIQVRFSGFEMTSELAHHVQHALRVSMR